MLRSVLWMSVALGSSSAPTACTAEPPTFERRAFKMPQAIFGTAAIDLNGDGLCEVLAVGETQVYAVVSPEWTTMLIADCPGGRFLHATSMDCDQDRDEDLVVARISSEWVGYRQRRSSGEKVKEPAGQDFTLAWLENDGQLDGLLGLKVIDTGFDHIHGVAAGDIDGDGMTDLVAGSFQGPFADSIALYRGHRRQVGNTRAFVTHGGAPGRAHYLDVGDLIPGGDKEIVLAASSGGTVHLWQNADAKNMWTSQPISLDEPGATNPVCGDVDGDGLLDVTVSNGHGRGVHWFRAPHWERHVIDDEIVEGHAFGGSDLDGDGDIDFALTSFSDMVTVWYENLGQGKFRRHDIDVGNQQQAYDLKIVDVDGDALKDIVIAGRHSRNVVWYRQTVRDGGGQ